LTIEELGDERSDNTLRVEDNERFAERAPAVPVERKAGKQRI
jgi:hypothetical protein